MSRRRLLGLLVILGLGGAAWFHRSPIELPAGERERIPSAPETAPTGHALLLVDDSAIRDAAGRGTWSALDPSYAWWSLLREEWGDTAILDVGSAGPEAVDRALASATWIVVSRSAGPLDPSLRARLARAVDRGAMLWLDQPKEALAADWGFVPRSPLPCPPVSAVTSSLPFLSDPWWTELPTPTTWTPGDSPGNAQAILETGDGPAIWRIPHGRGAVLLSAIDLARWFTALRQGVPQEDFSIVGTRGSGGRERYLQPNDFMADPDRTEAWTPRADLLIRSLLRATLPLPWPRLSPVPAGQAGLFLMTHDEEGFGDRSTFMSDESARQGVTSTFYLIPRRMTVAGTQAMLDAGAETQLHWNRGFWQSERDRLGLGPWRPLVRDQSLHRQVEALRAVLPDDAPPIDQNRNHGLLWDAHWTRTFRILEANGFRFDSTYGPDETLLGWVFDTARPYHPLDATGFPFSLVELPFPFQDDERYPEGAQTRLLRESAAGLRAVMAPIFHTVTMQWNPAAHRMRGWLDAYEEAPHYRHDVRSVGSYLDFRANRLASTVRARVDSLVHVQVEVRGDEQALEVPALDGHTVEAIRVGGEPVRLGDPEPWGWWQVPLPRGSHAVTVRYSRESPR